MILFIVNIVVVVFVSALGSPEIGRAKDEINVPIALGAFRDNIGRAKFPLLLYKGDN